MNNFGRNSAELSFWLSFWISPEHDEGRPREGPLS